MQVWTGKPVSKDHIPIEFVILGSRRSCVKSCNWILNAQQNAVVHNSMLFQHLRVLTKGGAQTFPLFRREVDFLSKSFVFGKVDVFQSAGAQWVFGFDKSVDIAALQIVDALDV